MRSTSTIVALLTGFATATAAFAQSPIVVTVKDTASSCTNQECVWASFASTAEVRIDLGAVWQAHPNFDFIRVDSTDNSADIYRITLHNESSGFVPSDVRLLIADRSGNATTFPILFNNTLPPACNDWGGTDTAPGPALVIESSVPSSTRVILAAAVGGDIRGDITCGQVFTLQALAGSISGTVRATSPDNLGFSDLTPEDDPDYAYAIQRIICRDGIFGAVIAGQPDAPAPGVIPPNCSIRAIIAGGESAPNSAGIQGSILAYGGHIRSVSSSGPIGAESAHASIQSRWGLTTLVCEAFESNDVRQPRDVHANVRVNWVNDAPPIIVQTGQPREVLWDDEGWVRQMIISGDLHGSIDANIMRPKPSGSGSGYEGSDPGGNSFGMFITGSHNAEVTLRQGSLVTSMAAAEFTEPIVIDTYMKGKIVATQGRIESLSIGADPRQNPLGSDHGFIASVQLPDWDPTVEEWPANGDEPEAVIRAATSIGTLAISQMVKGNKNVPPMVETPRIDVLRLGLLHSGVVWSGVRTGCTPGASVRCGADPSDAACYVSLGDAEIVDTWAKAEWAHEYDTAIYVSSFDRLDILKRHRAELWLDDLQTEEHLRIGCAFGREQNFPSDLIAVQGAEGLHGQITIGAHAPSGATGACEPSQGDADLGWWEQVTLAANSPAVVLAPDNSWPSAPLPSSAADVAPHYARLSADLGGGAVGLVPFALHDEDCDPPAGAAQASRTFLNSEFCHIPYARNLCEGSDPGEIYSDASIYLQFYGPILAESANERPYEIGIEVNGQPDFSTDYGMWTQYETLPQLVGGAERRLRLSGGEFTQLLAGH